VANISLTQFFKGKAEMKINPKNERLKHEYFIFKHEAEGKDPKTIDTIAKAILRFEDFTSHKDFGTFNRHQAIAFKNHIAEANNKKTGAPMALATQNSTLKIVQGFFRWLAFQRGYKKKIHMPDVEYLNLSANDARAAKSSAPVDFPSMEQMRHVIAQMPFKTEIEKRDRAIVAFTILTAARVGAIVSLKIKDFDQSKLLVSQNPNHVNTKFSKRIETYLMVIDETTLQIFLDWVAFIKTEKLFSPNSPLFPKTQNGQDENKCFKANGLSQDHWAGTTAVRDIFKKAFNNAGIKYHHPHSLRHTIVHFAMENGANVEELKALSQNIGHESPLVTLGSYGEITNYRQGELIKRIGEKRSEENLRATLRRLIE